MFNLIFKPCFIHVKWCLREINLQNKMAIKVTKKVKYAITPYHNVTRSTFYMKSFVLFSKSAQLLDYAALLNSLLYTVTLLSSIWA